MLIKTNVVIDDLTKAMTNYYLKQTVSKKKHMY